MVAARELAPIAVKGTSREVVPYAVEGVLDAAGQKSRLVHEHVAGLDLELDVDAIDPADAERIKAALRDAITALETRTGRAS